MNLSLAEAELFHDAVDDYYGLWEATAGMKNVFPKYDETQLRNAAESTLRSLLSKGWIELCRRVAFEPDAMPLETSEVEATLRDPMSWTIPTFGEIEICYLSTDKGQDANNHHRVTRDQLKERRASELPP